jgi:hypothetical protein
MPELFSHCSTTSASVHHVLEAGLDSTLVARLSVMAASQRATLIPLMSRLVLTDSADARSLPLCARGECLSTSSLYKLYTDGGCATNITPSSGETPPRRVAGSLPCCWFMDEFSVAPTCCAKASSTSTAAAVQSGTTL